MLKLLKRATMTACMIGFIMIGAHVFSAFIALTQTTQSLVAWIGALVAVTARDKRGPWG